MRSGSGGVGWPGSGCCHRVMSSFELDGCGLMPGVGWWCWRWPTRCPFLPGKCSDVRVFCQVGDLEVASQYRGEHLEQAGLDTPSHVRLVVRPLDELLPEDGPIGRIELDVYLDGLAAFECAGVGEGLLQRRDEARSLAFPAWEHNVDGLGHGRILFARVSPGRTCRRVIAASGGLSTAGNSARRRRTRCKPRPTVDACRCTRP